MNKKGFTLVEIVVVIAILGVLAMLIVPAITGYLQRAKEQTAKSNARVVVQSAQIEYAEQYLKGNLLASVSLPSAEVLNIIYELSNAKGSINSIEADSRNDIVHLVYQEGDIIVTYCKDYHTHSLHASMYTIGYSSGFTNTLSSIWMFDERTNQYLEISIGGDFKSLSDYSYKDLEGMIFYYSGELMDEGYYIVLDGRNELNSIEKFESSLQNTNYTKNFVMKINIDDKIPVYDYSANKTVTVGDVYWIDFAWDDVDGPVLAVVTGGQNSSEYGSKTGSWRGDLTVDYSTNKSIWEIIPGY